MPTQAIVYQTPGAPGKIIDGLEDVFEEINAVDSDDPGNHMGSPPGYGLFVWTGEMVVGEFGSDWNGSYRRMTPVEITILSEGGWPFAVSC